MISEDASAIPFHRYQSKVENAGVINRFTSWKTIAISLFGAYCFKTDPTSLKIIAAVTQANQNVNFNTNESLEIDNRRCVIFVY